MPCRTKKSISNCSLLVCQSSGTVKKNYSLAWFSTSLGRGIVVPSINIMCNILKITSQYLILVLALLSCPILMWCPDYLLHLLCLLIPSEKQTLCMELLWLLYDPKEQRLI